MTDIILPDSRLEMPELYYPHRRPVGNVKLDYSNKFVKDAGEIFGFLDGSGNIRGMKSGVPMLPSLSSGAAWDHNVLRSDGTNGMSYGQMDVYTELQALGYSSGTLVLRFLVNQVAGSVSCLFQMGRQTGNFYTNTFVLVGSQTASYTDESIGIYISNGTAGRVYALIREGHNAYLDGQVHEAVFVIDGVDNRIYVDGERKAVSFKAGSGTTSGNFLNYSSANRVYLGQRNYPTQEGTIRLTGDFHHFAIYPTYWTDEDAKSHWDSPNQIFIPS